MAARGEAGHAGEVRSRRDAKRRARAQLNNGLPYPPSLLTRALRLFVPRPPPSSLPSPSSSPSLLLLSDPHPHAPLPSLSLARSLARSVYLPTYLPTYISSTYLPNYNRRVPASVDFFDPTAHIAPRDDEMPGKSQSENERQKERSGFSLSLSLALLPSCFRGLRARVTST